MLILKLNYPYFIIVIKYYYKKDFDMSAKNIRLLIEFNSFMQF